ncbi:MAG: alcohol dehydrogenase catalytic domain-containing protein [Pseudoxanthomonas sp.]
MKTNGYAALSADASLAPFSFERRAPRANDVAMEVLYCGVCHTDLHQARNDWGFSLYPLVPGHEIVGRVTAVGSDVTRYKVGDAVAVGCMSIPASTATSAARAKNSCAAKATPRPTTAATGSARTSLTADIPSSWWCARNSCCACRRRWIFPA